jgi:hypothetical protein
MLQKCRLGASSEATMKAVSDLKTFDQLGSVVVE